MDTQQVSSVTYVLVEEEELIRKEWLEISYKKNLLLFTYATLADFLMDMKRGVFTGQERFFLDQDMGKERGVGVRLAVVIKDRWPSAYASLVTAYPKWMFEKELKAGVIDDVFGKYPSPFDNQAYSAFEKEYEQAVWSAFREVPA